MTSGAMSSTSCGRTYSRPRTNARARAGQDQVDRRARAGAVGDVALELGHAERRPGSASRSRAGPRSRYSAGSTYTRSTACWSATSSAVESTCWTRSSAPGHPLDDRELLGRGRVADEHLEHEPVDLRLGQRVGALGLDRVLVARTRNGSGTGCVSWPIVTWRSCITSSSALWTLAGARLISSASSRFVNTGPERGRELAGLLVVDPRPDEVRRHEVRRELDALEVAADRLRRAS